MNLRTVPDSPSLLRIPRACGDEPTLRPVEKAGHMYFPAHAGMNLRTHPAIPVSQGIFPRMRE